MCCRLTLPGPMNLDTLRGKQTEPDEGTPRGVLGWCALFPCCLKFPDICIRTSLYSADGVTHVRNLHIFSKIIVTAQLEHQCFNMFTDLLL